MRILIVGSGGREHTLAWKIAQSQKVSKIYCAPGNAGTRELAENIDISVDDIHGLREFAEKKKIDLTVIGPELPLTMGIVDEFQKSGLRIFGPDKKAAEVEGSKIYTKNLLKKYNIRTAESEIFSSPLDAKNYLKQIKTPFVVKADGLAAGKGVMICKTPEEGREAISLIMEKKIFGDAGNSVIIEEFLSGEEASFLIFTDGENILPMVTSQDHKPIYDDDKGPNTGGMGAYSPAPIVNDSLFENIVREIMLPTIKGLASEGRTYKGVLYGGLMISNNQAKVLEFNVRFGDPEAQPILVRMKSDLVPVLEAAVDGNLDKINIEWSDQASVCVVMSSKGYPGSYEKGKEIKGIEEASRLKDVVIFHAGTAYQNNQLVNNGGRVLGVTALGDDIEDAIQKAYEAVKMIEWEGVHYRKDIGKKALKYYKK
ncbi:MAG TPA: phosphoribosylamine--glycine ligase [Nitrospinota bacterium]|nr:phosphoribosylamine--glycine ligase [Nitrospinota bacterium]